MMKMKELLREQPNFRKLPKRNGPTTWNVSALEYFATVGEHSGDIYMPIREVITTIRDILEWPVSNDIHFLGLNLYNTQDECADKDVAWYIIYVSPWYKTHARILFEDACFTEDYYKSLVQCADTRIPQLVIGKSIYL